MKASGAQWAVAAHLFQTPSHRICLDCARHINRTHHRPFSANAILTAAGGAVQVMPRNLSDTMAKNQKLRSSKSQMKDIKAHQVPTDLGRLPQAHLLPPLSQTLTLLGKDPRRFFRLLFHRARLSVMGPPSVWAAIRTDRKKDYITGKYVEKQPLQLKQRAQIACDLHKRLNTSISTGDLATVHEIACKGLEEKIKARQQYRTQSKLPPQTWGLVKYRGITPPAWLPFWIANLIPFKAATVMLDFAAPLPWGRNSYLRQVTVRIRSRQVFDKGDGRGAQARDVTEYVVIQSMGLDGQQRPWRIWGSVDPLPLQDVDKALYPEQQDKQDLSISEKFRMAFDGAGTANAASQM
ncbi:hypothetical protein DV735_g3947, partial [Chaetothyriales sp. CBS 134920]